MKVGYWPTFLLIRPMDKVKNTIKTNNLYLKNIGSFKLISKKERVGRNPKTKENFIISSRRSISFKVSKNLINILNKHE